MFSRRIAYCLVVMACLRSAALLQAEEHLSPAPAGSFTIVVIPDTQEYMGGSTKTNPNRKTPLTNPIFTAHTTWIAENIDTQKIVFVSHVGDIVDANERAQWEVARQCMDIIHGKIPYGISVGNHDMTKQGDSSLFQQYFPASRFAEFDWYGGCFNGKKSSAGISGNNANSYQLFSAGGMDFIILHLECNAPDDVIAWANSVLSKHADRRALITCHMGWGPEAKPQIDEEFFTGTKGRMQWVKIHGERGNTPQQIWEKCYSLHPHLGLVFSGDQRRTQVATASSIGQHGNTVHELMQDYQLGWLRLYRFLPKEDRIEVITFDPKTGLLCEGTKLLPDRSVHQFSLDYPMP